MPKIDYPAFDKYQEVKGVFVEGCVDRGDGSRFRHRAHAHTDPKSEHHGWICVLSRKRLYNAKGNPSELMLHELAHILTGVGHTDKWRAKLKELGGTLEYWYTKEYFQLKRVGIRIHRRIGKREAKQLLQKYHK